MINLNDVSIIIPTLDNTGDYEQDKTIAHALKECLISLQETTSKETPIIIASNGGDARPLPIEIDFNRFKRIHLWEQGQCKAVNAAVATTNTEWIMVSNSDMVYPFGWWEELTFPIENKKEIMCISPKLIEPNQQHAPTFDCYFCGGAGGDFDKPKWLEFARNYQKNEMPLRTGFNLPFLIKRELWETISGYDVSYDPWGSNGDSDLEYKIRLAGVQPYQNTNCIVYHFSQTSGTFIPQNQPHWNKNWQYFIDKWGFPRTDNEIWEASFSIPTKEEERKFCPVWENKYL
jgi:GT2 family glycosyltransferase